MLALSKVDLIDGDSAAAEAGRWRERLGAAIPVILTSSVTHQGLDELARELVRRVPVAAAEPEPDVAAPIDELAEHHVFRPAAERGYRVQRTGEHSYAVTGRGVERLVARYDLDNEDAMAHLERRLRGVGVIRALQDQGFQAGDDVEIAGVAFELDPNL